MKTGRVVLVGLALVVPTAMTLLLLQPRPPKAPQQWRVGAPLTFEMRFAGGIYTVEAVLDEPPTRVAVK